MKTGDLMLESRYDARNLKLEGLPISFKFR